MHEAGRIESGRMGRVAYARVAPNEDLVLAIEKLCIEGGFRHAFVRGALGSLTDACLEGPHSSLVRVNGPAVEIVSLAGEVRLQSDRSMRAMLTGVVADPDGHVYGGRFVSGANPVCLTFEVTLEEWLPDSTAVP